MPEKNDIFRSFLLGQHPKPFKSLMATALTGPASTSSSLGLRSTFNLLDSADPLADPGRVAPDDGDIAIGKGRYFENAAILFLDICSFSARPSETKEEQDLILRALNAFFPEMVTIAEENDARIEKNTGDGLLAWFVGGEKRGPSNSAERALKTAIEMRERNQQIVNPNLRSRGIDEIEFRVAIDCGPVTIANLGSPKRYHSNTAIGTKTNIACKLLRLGSAGDIIVGDVARDCMVASSQARLQAMGADTGWVYRRNGAKYPAWIYR